MTGLHLPLLFAAAHAGALYVNGVPATTLRSFEFTGVNVRVDANGDVWVDAPGYEVSLGGPAAEPPKAPEAAAAPHGVYWLVTEDNQSTGHVVEVRVNGTLVKRIQSGDEQVIQDLGRYLHVGVNTVTIDALPGKELGGGVMSVYVSTGSTQDGTLKLDRPMIDFSRRSTDSTAGASRSFELEVK